MTFVQGKRLTRKKVGRVLFSVTCSKGLKILPQMFARQSFHDLDQTELTITEHFQILYHAAVINLYTKHNYGS